jgi:hypothetical protein
MTLRCNVHNGRQEDLDRTGLPCHTRRTLSDVWMAVMVREEPNNKCSRRINCNKVQVNGTERCSPAATADAVVRSGGASHGGSVQQSQLQAPTYISSGLASSVPSLPFRSMDLLYHDVIYD